MSHSSYMNSNITPIEHLIKKTIKTHSMLETGDRVLVGLSGGADSIMLTHYLKFSLGLEVIACHINHNLRGEESKRDMLFVQQVCEKWNIPVFTFDIEVAEYAQKNKLTIEQAGRKLRYETFETVAKENNAQKIATAHTLSDCAETVIFNLARGTGLKGLCGIPYKRGNIIRPIISLTRQDVEDYCLENDLEFVTDSTNLQSIYSRNKIRHKVIPTLLEVNPQFYQSTRKTMEILKNEQDFLQEEAQKAYEEAIKSDGLSVEKLSTLHSAMRQRAISIFLHENQIEKNHDLINKIEEIVTTSKGKVNVKANVYIEIVKHSLIITDSRGILDYFEQELEMGEFIAQNGEYYTAFICDKKELDKIKNVYKKLLYIYLDYDKIIGKISLRQRKTGDKISLVGRNGTRSLKKLFIDDKLTQTQKSQTLVFSDDFGVVAVDGYGCDKRVAWEDNTKNILVILRQNR